MFCEKCGKNIDKKTVCPYCEHGKVEDKFYVASEKIWNFERMEKSDTTSRFIAGVLQIFLGCLGIGRFFLKSYKIGILQILVSAITLGFGGFIWGVIDGCRILLGKVNVE